MLKLFNKKPKKESKNSKAYATHVYSLGQPAWSKREYGKFADEGYRKNVIVYRCIDLISTSAAYVPLQVFNGDTKLAAHPLLDLLKSPNFQQSGSELIESIISYLLISGNSFIEIADKSGSDIVTSAPDFLYALRPDKMQVLQGKSGGVAGYRYTDNKRVDFLRDDAYRCNIVHLKSFNPTDNWYGMGAIEAAAYSIDQHNQAGAWNQSLLQNGARPSGALQMDTGDGTSSNLTDEQFMRLKAEMEEQYTGSLNAGRPMLLEGGLKWQEMSLSPRDMDFINSKNTSARDVALALGVPPQLLGIPGDSTYSNYQEARYALWENTILPILNKLVQVFNKKIAPLYGNNIKIGYNKNDIDTLEQHRMERAQALIGVDYLTDNEKRELMGFGATAGGDVLNKPQSIQPLEKQEYIENLVKSGLSVKESTELADLAYAD